MSFENRSKKGLIQIAASNFSIIFTIVPQRMPKKRRWTIIVKALFSFFPAESRSKADDISSLPLDAKLVPKQLIKGNEKSGTTPSLASTALAVTTAVGQGKKKAKKSTEKKQERKAAKTLSAILLAFILTWLPYSVLVLIKPILPRELEENVIINTIWEWSYYLCYINSTINPMLYALCNASFRRTYIRILTCRFGTQPRQPVNRYYYG